MQILAIPGCYEFRLLWGVRSESHKVKFTLTKATEKEETMVGTVQDENFSLKHTGPVRFYSSQVLESK